MSTQQISSKPDDVVIHYNKAHSENPGKIPPWVVKHRGESYYVHHFEVERGIGFRSKEAPDNPRTKAALFFPRVILTLITEGDQVTAQLTLDSKTE